jgi:hypothetical protein
VCTSYVPYGALPCIPLHSVTADTGDNVHPVAPIGLLHCGFTVKEYYNQNVGKPDMIVDVRNDISTDTANVMQCSMVDRRFRVI